jgi:Fe(3+) dicitrate transport protein
MQGAVALLALPALAQTPKPDSLKNVSLEEVSVTGNRAPAAVTRLADVSGTAIYAGKKNEVIQLDKIDANVALNNSRQLFARVPGINIVENDGAGISIGIATRGLNPNRITEFNTRQNGYDIAADALGYPENYYTPLAQALDRIEVVRGAASLQYGSQFGGLINYVFKRGPADRKITVNSQQTVGSFGLFSSFNSLGGTVGKLNYYAFFQHKQGDGWRENSAFNQNTAYVGLQLAATEKLSLGFQFTRMDYLTQQPGGLTDAQFAQDARASYRDRNWFAATWNLPALTLDYQLSPQTHINARAFALIANRSSLGQLSAPDTADVAPDMPRDYQHDDYRNGGVEVRMLHNYHLPMMGSQLTNNLLIGARLYHGDTHRRQGSGPGGSDADFRYLHSDNLEQSDFRFPSTNVAVFAENLFRLTSRLTLTPGVRYEYLRTTANGYYYAQDARGPIGPRLTDDRSRLRGFVLLGLGSAFDLTPTTSVYANFSQNYSPVNYNDVRTVNPNLRVDPNIQDVRGYNADLGYRGSVSNWLSFDASVFYLAYKNRIGTYGRSDNGLEDYRYRTNIGDSRSYGTEIFAEADALALLRPNTTHHLSAFASVAYTDAHYLNVLNSLKRSIEGRFVEMAPQWISRGGLSYHGPRLSATVQTSYTAEQFTDATNSRFVPNGILGVIPAYTVVDASVKYTWNWLLVSGGVGNVLDARYFTRRADGYPGPGILPSDGRNYYLTLGVKI